MGERAALTIVVAAAGLLVLSVPGLASPLYFDVYPIINATENQTDLDVSVPENIIGSYSNGEAVPALLVIDRLSTEEGDVVHFLAICKNEGNESVESGCIVEIFGSSLIYSGCDESGSYDGGISVPGGISMCKGKFNSPEGNIRVEVKTMNNSLLIGVPNEGVTEGILVITNKPGTDVWNGGDLPVHHPAVKGTASLTDYSEVEWTIEGIKGMTDFYGNNISSYPVKSVSSLKGEGILASPKLDGSSSGALFTAKLNYDIYSVAENTIAINDTLDDLDYSIWDVESNPVIETAGRICRIKASNGLESVLSTKKKIKNGDYTLMFHLMQPSNSTDGYGLIINHERPEEQSYWFVQIDKNGLMGIYSYKDEWELRDDSVTLVMNEWYRFEITNRADETNIVVEDDGGTEVLNTTIEHSNGSAGPIKFLASSAGGNGVEMFLDDVVLGTNELFADSYGRARGRIFQVPGQNYSLTMKAGGASASQERTVEPEINITYGEEFQSGTYSFEKEMKVSYAGAYRKQVINLDPNLTYPDDYVEYSCSVEGAQCSQDVTVSPEEEKNYTFSWEENGVGMEVLDWEQDMSKTSTDKLQYVIAPVKLRNLHHNRSYSAIKYETPGELCEQKNEAGFCTFYYTKLEPLETVTVNHSVEGDWIDVVWGKEEQDMSKESTIDVQYFRRSVEVSTALPIIWKDIMVEGNYITSFDSDSIYEHDLFEDFGENFNEDKWTMEENGRILILNGMALLQADKEKISKIATKKYYNNTHFVLEADIFPTSILKEGYGIIINYPRPEGNSYWWVQIDKDGLVGIFSVSNGNWSMYDSVRLPSMDKWYHFEIENFANSAVIKIKDGEETLLESEALHDAGSAAPIEFWANGMGGAEGFYLDNVTIKEIQHSKNILNAFVEIQRKKISYTVSEGEESITINVENDGNIELKNISGTVPIKNNYRNMSTIGDITGEYNGSHAIFLIPSLASKESVEIKWSERNEGDLQLQGKSPLSGLALMEPGTAEKSVTILIIVMLSFLSIRKWKKVS